MDSSSRVTLVNVLKAYQFPAGPERDLAVKNAMSTPEKENIVKAWVDAHPQEVVNSPIIGDLKTRVTKLFPGSPSLVADRVDKKITGSRDVSDASDIENAIVSGKLHTLEEYFKNKPQDLFKNADLIKMHLSIGTLSFADLIPILSGASAVGLMPLFLEHMLVMPMDMLVKTVSTKNSEGETWLHHSETLKGILPVLLERLSTQDLQIVLSVKNSGGQTSLDAITPEMIHSLSKSQCLRLTAVLATREDVPQEFMNQLPPFAHTYHTLLQNTDSYDPATIIQGIKNLVDANEDEKDAAIAHFIESSKIPLKDITQYLDKEEFLRLGPHLRYVDLLGPLLRYVDLEDFNDIPLAQELLKNCPNLNVLLIENGKILEGIRELPLCQTLDCSQCGLLTVLPELPLCQTLDCLGCTRLKALPALPLCQMLNCEECESLTALPALPLCQTLNCISCRSLTALPLLPLCQTLNCKECESLTALPALPLCQTLNCISCRSLTALPQLPLCQKLDCRKCRSLTALPELPLCQKLECYACPSLTALPALPLCQILECFGCPSLTALPALPRCRELDYSYCPGIRDIPEVPFNCHVVSESSTRYLTLNINVEQFATEPEELLRSLGQYLLKNRPFPNVCYFEKGQPSEGIDAGGVRRDFVTRLCENVFKTDFSKDDHGKYLFRDGDLSPQATQGVAGEEEAYRTLGALFALCYAGGSNFKTGPLFNEQVYRFLSAPGEPGSDEWLLYNYFQQQFSSPAIIESLISGQGELPQLKPQDLQILAYIENDEREDFSQFTQEYLIQHREPIRQKLLVLAKEDSRLREFSQKLPAVSWMAQEMKRKLGAEGWGALRAQGAGALKERVEGIINADALKAKLQWDPSQNVTPARLARTQEYLTTWIDQQKTPERLSLFVRAVTGNKTLCAADLKIEVYDRESDRIPVAHTCFYSIELSGNYESQEQFNQKLETLLSEGMAGTGFTFA